jgi:hypothetical protein
MIKKMSHVIYKQKHLLLMLFFSLLLVIAYLFFGKVEDLPAWIQAGGSVLAIIASFWIVSYEKRSKQLERQRDILAVAAAAQSFSEQIRKTIDTPGDIEDIVNPELYGVYHSSVATAYATALANIPFHEVGSHAAVQALLSMHVQFAHFLDFSIQELMSGTVNNKQFEDPRVVFEQYPEPERTKKIKELRSSQFETLVNNVRVHLDAIKRDYEIIKMEVRN